MVARCRGAIKELPTCPPTPSTPSTAAPLDDTVDVSADTVKSCTSAATTPGAAPFTPVAAEQLKLREEPWQQCKAEEALRRNRALQAALRRAVAVSQEATLANREQEDQLSQYIGARARRNQRLDSPRPTCSFFSDPADRTTTPPKNHDAVQRGLFREARLGSLGKGPWLEKESGALKEALRAQLQQEAFKRLYADRSQKPRQGPQVGPATGPQTAKQRTFMELCSEIREARTEDLWQMQELKTDWQRISEKLAARGVQRDGKSCFIHWIQHLHPELNHGAFTKREDMALLQLSQLHGGYNWENVAERMATSRTAWKCFARYQRSLNPSVLGSEWTEEDDMRARYLVGQAGASRAWYSLAARFGEGRMGGQLRYRYLGRVTEGRRIGAWTQVESRRLGLAQQIYGRGRWMHMARHLRGRSSSGCLQRFEGVDIPGLKRVRPAEGEGSNSGAVAAVTGVRRRRRKLQVLPWTSEEDSTLISAMEKYGAGNWCLVRQDLPGRTPGECFRRFQHLNPGRMADMYDVLLATKRKMLPSSFSISLSKRKRSELVASDFMLHLYEEPEGPQGARSRLTTGDPKLDRHLRRVNHRRLHDQDEALSRAVVEAKAEATEAVLQNATASPAAASTAEAAQDMQVLPDAEASKPTEVQAEMSGGGGLALACGPMKPKACLKVEKPKKRLRAQGGPRNPQDPQEAPECLKGGSRPQNTRRCSRRGARAPEED